MTSTNDLLARLGNLEDALTERKREGAKPEELRRAIVGFANSVTEGQVGVLYIGVDDKTGSVVGVTNPESLLKKLRAYCHDDAYPSIDHQTHVLTVGSHNIVALVVPPSTLKPHFAGAAYVRDGPHTRRASPEIYEQLIASRHSTAGALQRLGRRTLSLVAINKPLGWPGHLENGYREEAEGRVEQVDAQTVTFHLLGSDRLASESLKHITITRDDAKQRPLVIVQAPSI